MEILMIDFSGNRLSRSFVWEAITASLEPLILVVS